MLYEALDDRGAYDALLGSICFGSFVKHLIALDRVDGLYTAVRNAGRVKDAVKLVRAYCTTHAWAGAALAALPLGQNASGGQHIRSTACHEGGWPANPGCGRMQMRIC
jgi:hypothetical protein